METIDRTLYLRPMYLQPDIVPICSCFVPICSCFVPICSCFDLPEIHPLFDPSFKIDDVDRLLLRHQRREKGVVRDAKWNDDPESGKSHGSTAVSRRKVS